MKKVIKKAVAVTMTATMVLGTAQASFAGTYTVQKGDYLSKIAPKYNTTWRVLADMNDLANPNLIFPNQILQVPDVETAEPEKAVDPVDPVVEDVIETVAEKSAALTSLSVTTMDSKSITPAFAPDIKKYSVTVQSDIYGVLLKPVASEGAEITVTADITPAVYGEKDTDAPLVIEKSKDYDGYVVPLTQTYEGYDSEFVQTVTVDVVNGDKKETYTITITREDDSDVYALFTQDKFKAADGTEIEYNLYVPSDYDASKEYPVVLALHGSGQKTQSVDMILKRYQMATIWAKDSEKGENQCIVIAPQAKENWSVPRQGENTTFSTGELTAEGQAAYELLQKIKKEYSIDEDKEYLTGLSMGAIGSLTMVYTYPDEFAGMYIVSARYGDYDYDKFKPMSGKIYFAIAEDDPTVLYEDAKVIFEGWDKAGVEYETNIYPSGTFFYPTAHFSWVPAYADKTVRDWLFSKTK